MHSAAAEARLLVGADIGWRLTGREFPTYTRENMPGRLVRDDEER